jgi:hypothetical protein
MSNDLLRAIFSLLSFGDDAINVWSRDSGLVGVLHGGAGS